MDLNDPALRGLRPEQLRSIVREFIREDVGRGDRTTQAIVPAQAAGRAQILTREEAVVAGLPVAEACFDVVGGSDVRFRTLVEEGSHTLPGETLAEIDGSLAAILTAERTALNLLGRLSGIASLTARYVGAIAGTPARILDTRKTTPGLRILEKYAVSVGGAINHRFGLDDGILIKDNHIVAAGGVTEAVHRVRDRASLGLRIEVEVADLAQLDEAVSAGADVVMLDNMGPAQITEALKRAGGKVIFEASGGITLDNIRSYAETGVDYISVGALTHSAPSIDLTLEVLN